MRLMNFMIMHLVIQKLKNANTTLIQSLIKEH